MERTLSYVAISLIFIASTNASLLASPMFPPIIETAIYNHNYTESLNSSTEYIFVFNKTNESLEGARITVGSDATTDFPLTVVVKQKKGILSWQIPLLEYNTTSRTLCSLNNKSSEEEEFVTVSLSTGSPVNISFTLILVPVKDFHIRPGDTRKGISISPSEPVYYAYSFINGTENKSVIVRLQSDSEICMTFSIQNTSCPVFDLERNIQFSGYWQTVSKQGGITVPNEEYPNGFFIVLVVKGDDKDCTGLPGLITPRKKIVSLTVTPSISQVDYIIASLIAMSIGIAFCIAYIAGAILYKIKEGRILRAEQLLDDQHEDVVNQYLASPPIIEEGGSSRWDVQEDSSLDEDDIDLMEDALSDKEVVRTKLVLSVCDLARKEPKILRHKSRLYMYYLGTVAIFYTLPVVQLVITYQNVLHVTGNQDLCYYNFLCSHPFGFLSDFNHVYSNFGYVLLGLLFIFLTYTREKSNVDVTKNKSYGIPQHYGLFYAMGIALMMEGVLSGSYHVCPNHSNFQFDTSFMYIISVLCMVKIYQNRHPDINARAPVTFGVLALIIFLGLVGVLDGSVLYWILFTIIHLVVCLILTAQVYYMGRWKLDGGVFRRVLMTMNHDARAGIRYLVRPVYPARLCILIMANLANLGLAIFGNMHHEKDFATYLLAVLMSNLLLYTFFYIVMKLCYKERILPQPALYITLSFLTWSSALYFFINKTISWALTPAQSRMYNRPCLLFNFFDSHDIWHFLSALAMFFSFMVLLTLDDDLTDVHRSQIPVF
ncbi:SID1 transmembrane family member 1-like [Belonocnema kinseyi]|uniref:SID1 transmembrane family member 1-like n=1 Tax=Belonocnema kinseyi TaxID=2817044 RepID=UPI00143D9622|nr:SID1 transmembrane family member 1-like [Belonocnema kinseyi]